jgi:hypothetical protein
MKRFFSAFALLCLLCASAAATEVSVSGLQVKNWQFGGTTATLRVYSSGFTASDGTVVPAGSASAGPYQTVSCTVAGSTVTCPTFTIHTTTDALDDQTATLTGILFDSANRQRVVVFSGYSVPTSLGSSFTYTRLAAHNLAVKPVRDTTTYTKTQIDALYQGALFANPATTTSRGVGKSSVNTADPVFVETTDGRIPTQGESDAMSGTSGSPSASNPFVTTQDARLVTTKTRAQMLALSSPVAGQQVAVSDDVRGLWSYNGSRWVKVEPCVNPVDFGVLNDGTAQATTNFQAAADAAFSTTTGYNIVCPVGKFRWNSGTITLKEGVQLAGTWRGDPSHSGTLDVGLSQPDPANARGTTFLIDTGAGTSTGCFITAHSNAAVTGIQIYYPNQPSTAVTPTAYPYAVCARGASYTGFNQRFENLELVNAYQGISLKYGGRWTVRNVTGQFLKTGIDVDYMVDKSEITNFKNVLLWSSPFKAAPADNAFNWMNQNGTGINVGKADALTIISPFIFGSNKGIATHSSPPVTVSNSEITLAAGTFPGGVQWLDIIGGGVGDMGVYGLYFAGNPAGVGSSDFESRIRISGLDISSNNNESGGPTYGAYFHTDFVGNVAITNSHVGPFNTDYGVYNVGAPWLSITNTIFHDWDVAAIYSNSSVVSPYPTHLTLGNNMYKKANFLTLDLRDKVLGTDSGSLYTSDEPTAFNFTSTLSFHLNCVRLSDGGCMTGLVGQAAGKFKSSPLGNILIGPTTEVATNATQNLFYRPSTNGVPTGSPLAEAGKVPDIIDRANLRNYIHNGTTWWGASYSLFGSATLDFPSIAAQSSADLTVTVTGAISGEKCVAFPIGMPESGLSWGCAVTGSNTATVRLFNVTSGAIDPASRTWKVETKK